MNRNQLKEHNFVYLSPPTGQNECLRGGGGEGRTIAHLATRNCATYWP